MTNQPKYTVRELVKELEKMPLDMPVVTSGYEGDYENILLLKVVTLKYISNAPYYTGEFIEVENSDKNAIQAVAIEREIRDI